jgi:hypothetical protein
MTKNSSFAFYGHFHELLPIVLGSRVFESYDQKLVVFSFMAIFMRYFPQIWGSTAIYNDRRARYISKSYDPKFIFFVFFGHFHELFPTIAWPVRPDTCLSSDKNIVISVFYGRFHELLPTVLGF